MHRVIRLSRRALRQNLVAITERDTYEVLDIRANAYGHGAETVVSEALSHGLSRFLADEGEDLPRGAERVENPAASLELYGFDDVDTAVMSVHGEVINVKRVEAGAAVSYGYTYRLDRDARLALVALGYADGIPRAASSVCTGAVRGRPFRIAGRIAMDQLVLDVGDVEVAVGDEVTIWGGDGADPARAWGRLIDRSPESLTACIGDRFTTEWVA